VKSAAVPWAVNPRSKIMHLDIIAAYKARTLHVVEIAFAQYVGYSWQVNATAAERSAAAAQAHYASKGATVRAFPYFGAALSS
jgi:hypothetical protein